MEFLKALEDAKQLGVNNEDFLKIWNEEIKLKFQAEENKAVELRIASMNLQERAEFLDAGGPMKNHQKELSQQIKALKEELLLDNESKFQAISKLFENQATIITERIRNGLSSVLNESASNMNSELQQAVKNILGAHQLPAAGYAGNGLQLSDVLQTQAQTSSSSWCQFTDQGSESDEEELSSEEGAELWVEDLANLVRTQNLEQSRVYYLSDCPCRVQLSIWFDVDQIVSAKLSVFSATEHHLEACRIFTVTGEIENRNSGSYSPLFEGVSQPLRRLKPDKEKIVNTIVCLKTGSGSFDDVTFDELDRRGFVIDNSLGIKWYVTSEEV